MDIVPHDYGVHVVAAEEPLVHLFVVSPKVSILSLAVFRVFLCLWCSSVSLRDLCKNSFLVILV